MQITASSPQFRTYQAMSLKTETAPGRLTAAPQDSVQLSATAQARKSRPQDPDSGPLPTGILDRNFTYGLNWPLGDGGSHSYAVRTALPEGITREEANALLNRFNAPTADGLNGKGNDPNDTGGWVVEPNTHLPSGRVSYERGVDEDGNAWVRNTTEFPHVFEGTITRRVEERDGRYYILTEGEGQGGFMSNTRHALNAEFGPELFQDFDQIAIRTYLRERGGVGYGGGGGGGRGW